MTWNLNEIPSQKGKIAMITGANIGLGYETALALAGKEMEVILACRNRQKAETAKTEIIKKYPDAKVQCIVIDLSSLASVNQCVDTFKKEYKQLDLLINNAGIMMPPFRLTEDGFESQFGANYLGHFRLTGLLLPTIESTKNSRIVSLSSLAHNWSGIQFEDLHFQRKYSTRLAYGQSKIACLMFAYELQRRFNRLGYQTISVAAHPGASHTNLAQHMPKLLQWLSPLVGQSAKAGAEPTLFAALSHSLKGGEYIGPDGFRQLRGKPKIVGSNRASRNEENAFKLWKVSEELTKIEYLN